MIAIWAKKQHFADECIAYSRQQYNKPANEVAEILNQWEEGKIVTQTKTVEQDKNNISQNNDFEEVTFDEPLISIIFNFS